MTTHKPEDYTTGLGEIIRAHRLYIGLSQREMADRLDRDRRDYQRIESGRDACPPGLLGRIEDMCDEFAHHVELILGEAEDHHRTHGEALPVEVTVEGTPDDNWNRLVAGRAAVEAPEDAPVTLVTSSTTIVGKHNERSTA